MPSRPPGPDESVQRPEEPDAALRGAAWIDGRLFVRIALAPERGEEPDAGDQSARIVLVDSTGEGRVAVPSSTRRARPRADDRSREVEAWFDPRMPGGRRLAAGRWRICVRSGARGAADTPVSGTASTSAALLAGEVFVVGADADGRLVLDAFAEPAALLSSARMRAGAESERRGTTIDVSIPLDGVHVHGRGEADVALRGEAAEVGDDGEVEAFEGTARLIARGSDLRLTFGLDPRPASWRLTLGSPSAPRTVRATVAPDGDVATAEDAMSAGGATDASGPPRVTVVACARADADLEAALASVRRQTLPESLYEIVTVPQGGRVDAQLLDRARGDRILFIDANDRMHPRSLERMLAAAEATGADVVLGRVLAVDHRIKTPKAFEATRLDAEVERDRLLEVATAHQLVRRELLTARDLVRDVDLPSESGRLLAVDVLLDADRIVTLTDLVHDERHGAGPTRISAEQGSSPSGGMQAAADVAVRTAAAILRAVPVGAGRDALLRAQAEPIAHAVLDAAARDQDERARIVARLRPGVAAWWTDGVRSGLDERTALVVDVLERDDVDGLAGVVEPGGPGMPGLGARITPKGIVYALPPATEAAVPLKRRLVSTRAIAHMVTSITTRDGVAELTGWVGAPGLLGAPDGVRARLRRRGRGNVVDLPVTLDGPVVAEQPQHAVAFRFRIDPAKLWAIGGVWDVEVAPVWQGQALPATRFGSRRPARIDEPSVDVTGRALRSRFTVLYASGGGNLAVAHRRHLRATALRARALGLDADGRPELIVSMRGRDPKLQFHAEVAPAGPREARHRLPWRRLDDRRIAVRLPVPASGSLTCELSAVHGSVGSAVRVARSAATVSSAGIEAKVVDGGVVVSRIEGGS